MEELEIEGVVVKGKEDLRERPKAFFDRLCYGEFWWKAKLDGLNFCRWMITVMKMRFMKALYNAVRIKLLGQMASRWVPSKGCTL